ncbi:MAG: nucleotidyltransferase domain-containing protein [Azospirillaceae bacterium]|nr:nucleotidyltransferase domain-containing protein [Azospirillaceae bacterium]
MAAGGQVPEALLMQVVSVLRPRRVMLFGSQAQGDGRADSDYDLVVVLDDDTPNDRLSSRWRYEARRGFPFAVGIVASRESVLKERGRALGSFAHTVRTEGVAVYQPS